MELKEGRELRAIPCVKSVKENLFISYIGADRLKVLTRMGTENMVGGVYIWTT